jgi:hypothetical protein
MNLSVSVQMASAPWMTGAALGYNTMVYPAELYILRAVPAGSASDTPPVPPTNWRNAVGRKPPPMDSFQLSALLRVTHTTLQPRQAGLMCS